MIKMVGLLLCDSRVHFCVYKEQKKVLARRPKMTMAIEPKQRQKASACVKSESLQRSKHQNSNKQRAYVDGMLNSPCQKSFYKHFPTILLYIC
jgi:hypothetical protein